MGNKNNASRLTVSQRLESAAYGALNLFGLCAKFVSGKKTYEKGE